MAEINWTKEQNDAIYKKDSNILVAAAAGSGKTAVLVERIIRKIIDDGIDIDKLLVVTFTNAAASEMREKILNEIYKKIDENPNNNAMHRQINLLNKSSICTIDSFCLDVIRNHFFEIDVSANARVADTVEINLLKQEVLEELFEEKYMNDEMDFIKLIEKYTKYNKDEELQELILEIYNYIQTTPFPNDWLKEKVQMLNDEAKKENLSESIWGKILIEHINDNLESCISKEKSILKELEREPELSKFSGTIEDDIQKIEVIKNNLNNWDKAVELTQEIQFQKWPINKKVENNLKSESKEIRDKVKSQFNKTIEIMNCDSKQAFDDIKYMHSILVALQELILEFSKRFASKKIEKNIIDFNDIEHLALKILVNKDENGNIEKTDVAKMYSEKFVEIAIDEYQDSNDIQELILKSVSRDNNIFMVGDVKQSIYKFRQACPELFLEKYETYKTAPQESEDRKIQLFKNFRSRKNILDFTNIVFKNIMSKKLGEIDYNQDEYLNLGADYEEVEQDLKTELNIIDLKEEENIWKSEEEEEEDDSEKIENIVLEARFVANRIKQLIDNKYQVYDKKKGYRNIEYKDIVVLLRSANVAAPIYEKELSENGISVYTDISKGYLDSIEIDTVMSVLKVINNPMQDIPLVTVMRSAIGNFTDNELLEISLEKSKISFYNRMINYKENTDNLKLKEKIENFLDLIEQWRKKEKYISLDELIWKIYIDTGYLEYVSLLPNGKLKVENLKLLFEKAKQYENASYKGLYNFINFIDKIKQSKGDTNSAKIIGENENVVRIMTIHKSKGLEFPVVILAESGKNFNFMSLTNKILLHRELGIGPQYIDESKNIEFKTFAKLAISLQIKNEMLAEEMRILYVALTRAKEKLIITGIQKDYEKSNNEKNNELTIFANEDKINSLLISKYRSYLDWLQLVYIEERKTINSLMELKVIKKDSLFKQQSEEVQENIVERLSQKMKDLANSEKKKEIKEKLNWEYDFKGLENITAKSSVTKIKELLLGENDLNNEIELEKPKFLNNKEDFTISGAQKGTLMHLCLKMMDENKDYDKNSIKELINELIVKELITEIEAQAINITSLEKYAQSDLFNSLKTAKEVHKEQPFYISIPANEIYELSNDINEDILLQGIIDLYFITQNDELVLIDYKTDYIKLGEEEKLVNEYKTQLQIYKRALEQSLKRKVDKVIIYSLSLNKTIEVKEGNKNEIR